MGFRSFFSKLFSSAAESVTKGTAKTVSGVVKDVSGTAKDVTGIRRDLIETKLAQYKVEEHESMIQRATLDDIREFDAKFRELSKRVEGMAQLRATLIPLQVKAHLRATLLVRGPVDSSPDLAESFLETIDRNLDRIHWCLVVAIIPPIVRLWYPLVPTVLAWGITAIALLAAVLLGVKVIRYYLRLIPILSIFVEQWRRLCESRLR
jgi:hypothetical protein